MKFVSLQYLPSKNEQCRHMADVFANLRRLARISISFLPSLLLSTLLFGALFASITLLRVRSPLVSFCEASGENVYNCRSRKALSNLFIGPNVPSLTIFTAPARPFFNSSDDPQYQALLSWLRLEPTPKIVLLGKDATFYRVAKQLCDSVSVEPNIDYNLWGTPHVHSMFARAQQEETDVSMIADTNTFLFQDVMDALKKVYGSRPKWVLLGKSRAMDRENFGVTFKNTGSPGLVDVISTIAGFPSTCREIADLIKSASHAGPVSYWAWNNVNMKEQSVSPFLKQPIPPFSYVKGTFENWILRHLIDEAPSHRDIIDASEAITSIMISSNSSVTSTTEEARINGMLSDNGDDDLNSVPAPWKMMRCKEPSIQNLCLVQGSGETSMMSVQATVQPAEDFGRDHSPESNFRALDILLPQVADENKIVVMVGGTSNYKEMLLSFICRAQSLGIQNVLIAAFDEALYEYAYLQGLPVYLESPSEEYRSAIGSDGQCIFASECFKRVSKLKSMSVLRVLKKGYSVLWSDMDIAWFENPLPQLMALAPDALLIQSDEPNEKFPENSIMGANSGFYLARSDERTIQAFQAIVEHAMKSKNTEQPSFYTILCGEKGERRVGNRECVASTGGLRTVFLDHKHYPNGHVYGHWDSSNATESCRKNGCALLHNNFIAGKENKLRRFVKHGLWFYDVNARMCLQPWHPLQSLQVAPSTFQAHFANALNITQYAQTR